MVFIPDKNSNRGLFLTLETSGAVVDTYIQATGKTTLLSHNFIEDSEETDNKILSIFCADDDASTPTIRVDIALSFDDGISWDDWQTIQAATAVPTNFKISSYDKTWWIKNTGVKFRLVKSGAGAVTHTSGRWQ